MLLSSPKIQISSVNVTAVLMEDSSLCQEMVEVSIAVACDHNWNIYF
jgi:hypothetical protein